jgi:hypothetical protein
MSRRTAAAEQFAAGYEAGTGRLGPAGPTDGDIVTPGSAWWHHQWCETCGHTFRRGDAVRLSGGRVGHLDPALACLNATGRPPASTAAQRAFNDGLHAEWPAGEGAGTFLLAADDPLLAPPLGDLRRAFCRYCGHTFRPDEHVVQCPCRPDLRRCAVALHRDPAGGLMCWEAWITGGRTRTCPVTLVEPLP